MPPALAALDLAGRMGFFIERVAKPAFLALITFLAVRYITKSAFDGFIVALIPGVLGLTNIYVKFGYAVAAISLIVLASFVVMPAPVRDPIVAKVTGTFNDILHPATNDEPKPPHASTHRGS